MSYVLNRVFWLHHLGTIASVGCLVQCVLFPILVTVLPVFGFKFGLSHDLVMPYFMPFAFLFGTFATIRGFFWHHHNKLVLLLFLCSLLVFSFSLFYNAGFLENILHLSATCILVGTHLYNNSLCNQCRKCRGELGHS